MKTAVEALPRVIYPEHKASIQIEIRGNSEFRAVTKYDDLELEAAARLYDSFVESLGQLQKL